MGTEAKDGAAVRMPPPLLFLTAVLVGVGLQLIRPLPLGLPLSARLALAGLFALVGLLLMAGALRLFQQTGQDPKPWLATPEIITGGVYRFTRNPMYISFALLQLAIGFGVGNLWVILLVPIACLLVQITAIRPEESYLESKFGDSYRDYKKSVRRWL